MKLIIDPDPILRQVAEPWDFEKDTGSEQLEKDMIEIMQTFNGIGLAGNQVGLLKRVLTIKLKDNPLPFAMFNPIVVEQSEEIQKTGEGCLSFPNLWLDVDRPKWVVSEFFDKEGKKCTIKLQGIDARCFLHELDHLNGIVFTEKVKPMALMLARKKQRNNNGRTK